MMEKKEKMVENETDEDRDWLVWIWKETEREKSRNAETVK